MRKAMRLRTTDLKKPGAAGLALASEDQDEALFEMRPRDEDYDEDMADEDELEEKPPQEERRKSLQALNKVSGPKRLL